jgi:uncharacterized protein (DUF885 family)
MKSREALTQRYYDIGKAVDAKLPQYFSTMPKTPPRDSSPTSRSARNSRPGGSYSQAAPTAATRHFLLQRL